MRVAVLARMLRKTQLPGALAAALVAVAALLTPACALDLPARAGRVVDEVGLIDAATRARIDSRLEALEAATADQVVVVVVGSLRGTDIDTFNRALSQHWGLGGREGRGALLVLAPNDGKIGMHAGTALGDQLTRAVMDRIFDQSVVPAFARHDAAGGLGRATDDIVEVLTGVRPPDAITIGRVAAALALPAADPPRAAAPSGPSGPATRVAQDTGAVSPAGLARYPALTGRVVDEAGILGGRRELTDRLAALEARTSDQVVVAAVRSLRGQSIEEYANGLFRDWKLGQKDKNNGVLLLVAPNERKVRIEVGYGLEGVLTDALSKIIIEQSILPRFKANDMAAGVVRGVDDIIRILTEDPVEAKRRAQAAKPSFFTATILPLLQTLGAYAASGLILAGFALMAVMLLGMVGYVATAAVVNLLVWLHVLPKFKDRSGRWSWLNTFNSGGGHAGRQGSSGSSRSSGSSDSSWSSSSSSSGSSDSFSGGGGDSGGGGSSGSW